MDSEKSFWSETIKEDMTKQPSTWVILIMRLSNGKTQKEVEDQSKLLSAQIVEMRMEDQFLGLSTQVFWMKTQKPTEDQSKLPSAQIVKTRMEDQFLCLFNQPFWKRLSAWNINAKVEDQSKLLSIQIVETRMEDQFLCLSNQLFWMKTQKPAEDQNKLPSVQIVKMIMEYQFVHLSTQIVPMRLSAQCVYEIPEDQSKQLSDWIVQTRMEDQFLCFSTQTVPMLQEDQTTPEDSIAAEYLTFVRIVWMRMRVLVRIVPDKTLVNVTKMKQTKTVVHSQLVQTNAKA